MGNKDHISSSSAQQNQTQIEKNRVEAVLRLLRKPSPLTLKQEKFCNEACVTRFLKAKGESVKKAAKQLRASLSWRENLGVDHLIADEFSGEIADGMAYVAGHDDQSRPVVIFRIKQDYLKFRSQKQFTRLLVFTLEVAIQTMAKSVDQLVVLFDASFFRSASGFMNLLVAALKTIGEHYPGRLHKAFVIDPPSLFPYLWKGVKAFIELSSITTMVSSIDFDEFPDFNNFTSYPRAASLRFNHNSSIPSKGKIGACSSSRFSFTVSHHFDSLKPWYLTLTDKTVVQGGSRVHPGAGARSDLARQRPFLLVCVSDRKEHKHDEKELLPVNPIAAKDPSDGPLGHQPTTNPETVVPTLACAILQEGVVPRQQDRQVPRILRPLLEILPTTVRRDDLPIKDEASTRRPHLDRLTTNKAPPHVRLSTGQFIEVHQS
ncbi:hypothetical protein OSB04_031018 [Centaurea solstitialis]|uniref:CRAL-TRIO domain-containing protein n=1 Tax=Centaurea solstitialis TaxID=347529 RepID=A0AA38SLD2_9ASTR|nr:hypothetical protein OSB04_031018 [Centaurea solstitialis]